MSAIPLLNRWLLLPDPGPELAWTAFQSGLGLVAALAMGVAFLRPSGSRQAVGEAALPPAR